METLCHIDVGNVSYASVAAWTNQCRWREETQISFGNDNKLRKNADFDLYVGRGRVVA